MRIKLHITSILLLLITAAYAQNDTMYVIKNGIVTHKISVNSNDVDSIVFYKPDLPVVGTFTDARDNKQYKYISMGTQTWMTENLAYLPEVDSVDVGSEDFAGGKFYYVYGFTPTPGAEEQQVNAAKSTVNYQTYGALYNWYAAMDACPAGWHLPTDAEWTTLTDFLGGESQAGGKMKDAGTDFWASPNSGATNSSNFSALPGGYRWNGGSYALKSTDGLWWTATESFSVTAMRRWLTNKTGNIDKSDFLKDVGFSVRCVKN